MKLKPYKSYKDSGVEWLGEVPEGWKPGKIKHICRVQNGFAFKANLFSDMGPIVLRMSDIGNGKIKTDAAKRTLENPPSNQFLACDGDVVVGLSGSINNYAFVEKITEEMYLNQRVAALRGETKLIKWVIQSNPYIQQLLEGVPNTTIINISDNQLKNVYVVIPTCREIDAISNFLDRETAKLDTLITKQEKLIELLQEKRQAIISHAVTKGLNPDAKMKDSGVEWLGRVPEEWRVIQFRHMASIQNGSDYKHIESDDGEYPVIGSGGEFKRATDYIYDGPSVLLGRKGTIDKPLYIEGKFWVVDTMFYTVIKDIVLPKFVFNCSKIIPFDLLSTSTALPSMTQNDLKQLVFAIPESIKEQLDIVEFIDNQTGKIDNLIEKAKRSIELAKEHRTALISAAVTGKIDVREAA